MPFQPAAVVSTTQPLRLLELALDGRIHVARVGVVAGGIRTGQPRRHARRELRRLRAALGQGQPGHEYRREQSRSEHAARDAVVHSKQGHASLRRGGHQPL